MAVPANTLQTFAMSNIKEDLSDIITMTDPTEVPFYSLCKKGTAKSRTPENLIDSLDAPNPNNKNIEGDAATNDGLTGPTRFKNVVQLFDKVIEVSSTSRAVDTAGMKDPLSYQKIKKGKEMKRDIEARATGNYASVLGAAGTAGEMAGFEAYIKTNAVRNGAGAASGGFNSGTGLIAAATDGAATVLVTETMLKDVIAKCWNVGGDPSLIMVNGKMKQKFSGLPGIATQYRDNPGKEAAVIIAAADVYKSDFGLHTISPNRFICHGGGARDSTWAGKARTSEEAANRSALVIDPSSWTLAFLQPMKTEKLAKLGHSDREMLSCELTLECSDESKNGIISDIKAA